jgi:hypothetical protein
MRYRISYTSRRLQREYTHIIGFSPVIGGMIIGLSLAYILVAWL